MTCRRPTQTADALRVPISAAPRGVNSRVLADRGLERVVEAMSLPVVSVPKPPDKRAAESFLLLGQQVYLRSAGHCGLTIAT